MKKAIFRTMGGSTIGYGHYYRCITIAKAVLHVSSEMKIQFIINDELLELAKNSGFDFIVENSLDGDFMIVRQSSPDIFVLDSYLADNEYLLQIKSVTKVVLVDDNNNIYDSTIPDILVNGNIHAPNINYIRNPNSHYLLGLHYLSLKNEYWFFEETTVAEETNQSIKEKKPSILVTTGATDNYHVSYEIIKSICFYSNEIVVIIGPAYPSELIRKLKKIAYCNKNILLIYSPQSLKQYIDSADLIITAGGSTVYEVCVLKKPFVIFSMIDNQDLLCKMFESKGVLFVGKYPTLQYEKLTSMIIDINTDSSKLEQYQNELYKGNLNIDGFGALRIARKLIENMGNQGDGS